MQVTQVQLAVPGGNLVNAILSISGKREILFVPVRESNVRGVCRMQNAVLDDLCEIQWQCFCLETPYSIRKETLTTQMHRPRYTQAPVSDRC